MTTYTWPSDFPVNQFEMRIAPNSRTFVSPYAPASIQTIDLLGERWIITMTMPSTNNPVFGAHREAFFNRLQGQTNSVAIWHQKLTAPQGTLRGSIPVSWKTSGGATMNWTVARGAAMNWSAGSPVVVADIQQLANTGVIQTIPGRTLLAGDPIGIGGQLVQIMATATANGSGLMAIEFQPRARQLIPAGASVLWDRPTANFILKPGTDGVPTSWVPGEIEGTSFDLIEIF